MSYYTAYEVSEGRWRASTDLGYFNGTSPSDVRDRYEDAKAKERRVVEAREIAASLERQDAHYRKHPRTEATS